MGNKNELLELKQDISQLRGEIKSLENEIVELNTQCTELYKVLTQSTETPAEPMYIYDLLCTKCYVLGSNGKKSGNLLSTCRRLSRAGINTVNDLEGKTFFDLLNIRNLGPSGIAILLVVCEHYGIKLNLEDFEECMFKMMPSERKKVESNIEKYKSCIKFRD